MCDFDVRFRYRKRLVLPFTQAKTRYLDEDIIKFVFTRNHFATDFAAVTS